MIILVGEAPRLISDINEVVVTSPEVATLEFGVRPGMDLYEIHWYVV